MQIWICLTIRFFAFDFEGIAQSTIGGLVSKLGIGHSSWKVWNVFKVVVD
jgi:hypothetical protein